jgi:TRIC channel
VQLHNTNAVVHAAFLLFVLLLQARAAGKTAWLESITFVTLSTFGGTIVAPLLLRQPPDILTNDIIVPVIAVTWYMVNQSPRDAVPRVLSKPVLHQLLVALMETYRASTLCTMVAAASIVLNSTTTGVQTLYTVALFGPIIVGTAAASAGLFIPCDKGLSCLELGLPWPIQSAIYAATFYHIAVYDTGAVGGALRTYILGDSVDAATICAIIAAVFAVTGVLQTTFGPGFNVFRPLNLLNYAITGVQKVPAAFKKARKTAAVRHIAPPHHGIKSRANWLTLQLSNGNSTHHNGTTTTATANGSSINSNSATAAARLLNLSGHSKRTSRLRGTDKGTTTAKTANTNAISVNSNASKDDGNTSNHSDDSVSSSNTTIHQTVRKPAISQHARSKKRVIKLTVKQKWQQWIENTTLPLLLLMWLLKQLLYADNRQFWSTAAMRAAAAIEKAQHIAVTFLTLQWWGGLEVCLIVFALMGSMKVRQGSARAIARNAKAATAIVKAATGRGISAANGHHANTAAVDSNTAAAAAAAALNNSDHNVMSRLRRLSVLSSTPMHWLEGVSTVCVTTFGGGILAPLLLRQPPTLFTNDFIVPAVATSWYLVNHSWRDSIVTVSTLSGVHHLLVILAEVSQSLFLYMLACHTLTCLHVLTLLDSQHTCTYTYVVF